MQDSNAQALDALDLMWKQDYLHLDKWDDARGWLDRAVYADRWKFVSGTDFRLKITDTGRKLLA